MLGQNLTFSLIHPQDITIIQQMVQGTQLSGMSFNRQSMPIFVAQSGNDIVGFTCGQKGYGDHSHEMKIRGTYLYNAYDDPDRHNQYELQVAFLNWAKKSLGVTHYKLGDVDELKPICIGHVFPVTKIETPLATNDVTPQVNENVSHQEYDYH